MLSQRKIGKPSFSGYSTVEEGEEERKLRLNAGLFDSKLCPEPGGRLHNVEIKETGKPMLYVTEKHSNDRVFRWLNSFSSPDDSISNKTKYHLRCWVDMKGAVQQKDFYETFLQQIS